MRKLRNQFFRQKRIEAYLLLLVIAIMVAIPLGFQAALGTFMLGGVGITLVGPCDDIDAYACDPCLVAEGARVIAIGYVFHTYTFIDPSDPAEWAAAVASGYARIIPNVSGEYDGGTDTEGPGYGRRDIQITGVKHVLTYDHEDVLQNINFYNKLRYSKGWTLYYVTQTQIWQTNAEVTISAKKMVPKELDQKVTFKVTVKWNHPYLATPYPAPADIFDDCTDVGTPAPSAGFGFTALPIPGDASVVTPGVTYDLVFNLQIGNSSVPPGTVPNFTLAPVSFPPAFTLITATVPNTGIGSVASLVTVRVDTSVAGWREVDDLQLSIDGGVGGTQTFNLPYNYCRVDVLLNGAIFSASASGGGVMSYVNTTGAAFANVYTSHSCFETVTGRSARTRVVAGIPTLPSPEIITLGGTVLTTSYQAVSMDEIILLSVNAGGTGAGGPYLLCIDIEETGTDVAGNPLAKIATLNQLVTLT